VLKRLSADYWVANSTTLDAGGRITVRPVSLRYRVLARTLSRGFKQDWYDPATSYANFLVASDKSPGGWGAAAFRTFGPPAPDAAPGRLYRPGVAQESAGRRSLVPPSQ
jgi:hypothetical protein